MKEITVSIKNKLGIHARPAGQLVKLASKFKSDIQMAKNSTTVNAKSIMGVLMLEAGYGSQILVRAEGPDEEQALQELEELIVNRQFDEE